MRLDPGLARRRHFLGHLLLLKSNKRNSLLLVLRYPIVTLSTSVLNVALFTTLDLLRLLWQSSPYSGILTQLTYSLTWTVEVSLQPVCLETITKVSPDPRGPGQTRSLFKFRQPDDFFQTLKPLTVKELCYTSFRHGLYGKYLQCSDIKKCHMNVIHLLYIGSYSHKYTGHEIANWWGS